MSCSSTALLLGCLCGWVGCRGGGEEEPATVAYAADGAGQVHRALAVPADDQGVEGGDVGGGEVGGPGAGVEGGPAQHPGADSLRQRGEGDAVQALVLRGEARSGE